MEYCVVEWEYDSEKVDKYLSEGWRPQGGVFVTTWDDRDGYSHRLYTQAMVREPPTELRGTTAAVIQPGATVIICPADDEQMFTETDAARVKNGFERLGVHAALFRAPIRVWQIAPEATEAL